MLKYDVMLNVVCCFSGNSVNSRVFTFDMPDGVCFGALYDWVKATFRAFTSWDTCEVEVLDLSVNRTTHKFKVEHLGHKITDLLENGAGE